MDVVEVKSREITHTEALVVMVFLSAFLLYLSWNGDPYIAKISAVAIFVSVLLGVILAWLNDDLKCLNKIMFTVHLLFVGVVLSLFAHLIYFAVNGYSEVHSKKFVLEVYQARNDAEIKLTSLLHEDPLPKHILAHLEAGQLEEVQLKDLLPDGAWSSLSLKMTAYSFRETCPRLRDDMTLREVSAWLDLMHISNECLKTPFSRNSAASLRFLHP